MRRLLELEGFEVCVYSYRRGSIFEWHSHAEDKCDAVVEGTLRVEVDAGEAFDLRAGDRIYVPAGLRHRAEVIGERTVISLDGTKR